MVVDGYSWWWNFSAYRFHLWIIRLGFLVASMAYNKLHQSCIHSLYSEIIVPLFNKQLPLEEGSLRNAIEQFSDKAGFTLDNIYTIDGSKRSTKANAYFSGIGPKKRIVLYDTLIKDLDEEELVAVLAHEVGHYKKKHTIVGIALGILQTGIMLFILSFFISKDSNIALSLAQAVGGNN